LGVEGVVGPLKEGVRTDKGMARGKFPAAGLTESAERMAEVPLLSLVHATSEREMIEISLQPCKVN
jgi:hypothetical protein